MHVPTNTTTTKNSCGLYRRLRVSLFVYLFTRMLFLFVACCLIVAWLFCLARDFSWWLVSYVWLIIIVLYFLRMRPSASIITVVVAVVVAAC